MKRSLAEWASVAEILGAIAIVISLAFVGFQIRDNTRATQAASYQEHLGFEIELLTAIASDPVLSRIYLVPDEMVRDEEEARRVNWLMIATFRLWEGFYLQHEDGTMSERAWAAREPTIRSFSESPRACQ